MFTLTPIQGAQSLSAASSTLIQLEGGIKILVDVGWDVTFDSEIFAEIEKQTPTLSFILLTHATISHLGAFVHCQKFIPNFDQIPVYATQPVINYGNILLRSIYERKPYTSDENIRSLWDDVAPTQAEIDHYFSQILPLKYSQPHQPRASVFSAPLDDLTITAYGSGHSLGGTIWHIQHEIESIVYSVDWSIVRENVIPAASWFGGVDGSEVIEALRNPTALVCSSRGAMTSSSVSSRKARDDLLLDHIQSCVAKGGSVFIPAVSLIRLPELARLLEQSWQTSTTNSPLRRARLCVLGKAARDALRSSRALLDWMNDSIGKDYDEETAPGRRGFSFRHLKMITAKSRAQDLLDDGGSKVIITTDVTSSASSWTSRVLSKISTAAETLILLLDDRNADPTISALHAAFHTRPNGVAIENAGQGGVKLEQVYGSGGELTLGPETRSPFNLIDAQTLQTILARRDMETKLDESGEGNLAGAEDPLNEAESSSSEDESDNEQQGRALKVSAVMNRQKNKLAPSDEELGINMLLRKKDVHDYDVRSKKGRDMVFPYVHSRRRGDEFGDYIRPEDFLRAEEKDAANEAEDARSTNSRNKRPLKNQTQADGPPRKRQKMEQQEVESVSEDSSDSDDESDGDTVTPMGLLEELTVNARLAFVDFNGLHDQRSLEMLIPLVDAKKVILIAGTAGETSTLVDKCRDLLSIKDSSIDDEYSSLILAPLTGEAVDASVETQTWDVKIGKQLFRKLNWAPIQGRNVATLTGEIKAQTDGLETALADRSKRPKLMKTESNQGMEDTSDQAAALSAVLDIIGPNAARSTLSLDRPIHVGDVVLRELQRYLVEDGHRARFAGGGTLLVDDMVAVRKLGTGRIVLESAPTSPFAMTNGSNAAESFTLVKRKIYQGLPLVAAG